MNKLYSQRAITIATYFGGPIAAGILARRNFISFGNTKYGKISLYIGIISTIVIFVGIFLIPDKIIDKIPNPLIPLIYTGIIYLIIEKYQGKEILEHKENNGEFYTAWKAVGIGAICMALILSCLLTYIYATSGVIIPNKTFEAKYDNNLEVMNKNEEKALVLYDLLEKESAEKSIEFIDSVGIKLWKENIVILNELDNIKGIYKPLLKQNEILRNYFILRIESYNLIRKALIENTNAYDLQIENINKKIDLELSKLN